MTDSFMRSKRYRLKVRNCTSKVFHELLFSDAFEEIFRTVHKLVALAPSSKTKKNTSEPDKIKQDPTHKCKKYQ